MKKKIAALLILLSALSIAGCANTISDAKIEGYKFNQNSLTAVFPDGFNTEFDSSEVAYFPCSVDSSLESAGATPGVVNYFDARESAQDSIYYRVNAVIFDIPKDFPDIQEIFKTSRATCEISQINTIDDIRTSINSSTKESKVSLDEFRLSADQVEQFSGEESSLIFNLISTHTSSKSARSQVFAIRSEAKVLLLTVDANNADSNLGEFEYFDDLVSAMLQGLKS